MSNPIIPGFAPDPSITKIEDTYFIATSSFHLFPGIPIYASKDLQSWQHIGNAINRHASLSLRKSSTRLFPSDEAVGQLRLATAGLYAPTIRHRDGITYVVCTNVVHDGSEELRLENFFVSTNDIWSDKWSEAVYFSFHGIDPDLFWDESGRAFVAGSAWGDRTKISCVEIDLQSGRLITSAQEIWAGFTKVVPEGPHVYKRGDDYYLLISEGGTSQNHCLTIARSRSIWGPYESYSGNPILKRAPESNTVQHTGHGDLFQDAQGSWHIVCLGVRKAGDRYHMGRETFMTTVEWPLGQWPIIEPPGASSSINKTPHNFHESFVPARSMVDLVYIRDTDPSFFNVSFAEGGLNVDIQSSTTDLDHPNAHISFVGKRQRCIEADAYTELIISHSSPDEGYKAGLAIYKDEHRFVRAFWEANTSEAGFEIVNGAKALTTTKRFPATPDAKKLRFRLHYTAYSIQVFFQIDGGEEENMGAIDTIDLTDYDFVGPVIGIFCVSPQTTSASFRNFSIDVI